MAFYVNHLTSLSPSPPSPCHASFIVNRYLHALLLCLQWISEVMHFCAGLPVILVGCKKDLRRDPRVIDELRKTSQRPVSPEEVCDFPFRVIFPPFSTRVHRGCRVWFSYLFRRSTTLSPYRRSRWLCLRYLQTCAIVVGVVLCGGTGLSAFAAS